MPDNQTEETFNLFINDAYAMDMDNNPTVRTTIEKMIAGLSPYSTLWHSLRSLRMTSYGRLLYRNMVQLLSDKQQMHSLLSLSSIDPYITHPDTVTLMDTSGYASNIVFVVPSDAAFWDDYSVSAKYDKYMEQALQEDDVSETDERYRDNIPIMLSSMPPVSHDPVDAPMTGIPVETMLKIHALGAILRSSGWRLEYRGTASLESMQGMQMNDVFRLKIESELAKASSGTGYTTSNANTASMDAAEPDHDGFEDIIQGLSNPANGNSTERYVFELVRQRDNTLTDTTNGTPITLASNLTDGVRRFIEDSYPVDLLRDIIMHSFITGDEVIIDAIDENILEEGDFPSMVDPGVQHVSSHDCGWLLSDDEWMVVRFLGYAYRANSTSIALGLNEPEDTPLSFRLYSGLREQALREDDIVLKTIDSVLPWGTSSGIRIIKLIPAVSMDDIKFEDIHIPNEETLEMQGIDINGLKKTITQLTWNLHHDSINRNTIVMNDVISRFSKCTYSMVLTPEDVVQRSIDPLAVMPTSISGQGMGTIIKEVEKLLSNIMESPKLQYLGQNTDDARSVFTYVDDHGNVVNPQRKLNMSI